MKSSSSIYLIFIPFLAAASTALLPVAHAHDGIGVSAQARADIVSQWLKKRLPSAATQNNANHPSKLIFNSSKKPKSAEDIFTGTGRPRSRSSGGSRGSCDQQLVALVPGPEAVAENGCNLQSEADLALTTAAKPVVWVHVPEQSGAVEGEFALLDDDQLALSIQTIALPDSAGIIGIQLEEPLEVDRTYSWVFSVVLDPRKPSENPRVEGRIARIELGADFIEKVDTASSVRDQARLWIDYGIWHEALSTVVSLRQSSSGSESLTQQDWQDFLGSVGLGAIADAPLLPVAN